MWKFKVSREIIGQPTKSYPERDVIDNAAKLVDMFRKKDAGTSSACHYAKDNAKVVSNESFFLRCPLP